MDRLQLPARIGKYELIEFLGGGMSNVYRARDTLIGGTVALKILTEAANADAEARARFLREARMARNVAHENIVAIYDFGEEQGRPYMVMEFLRGESLRTAIQEGRTGDIAQKLRVAIQIAQALEFIHSQSIIHRDLKPDNIQIGADGRVKLMDFGIAKTRDLTITRAGYAVGTPFYMAPEQVTGQEVTHLADIYAFGIVLFEVMTGRKPVEGDSVERIFYEILSKPLDLAPMEAAGVPTAVRDLVARCTAKGPADRIQSFAAIAAELARTLREVESAAAPAGNGAERRRKAPWLIALGGIVILAAAAWLLWGPEKPPAQTISTPAGEMVLVPAGKFLFGPNRQESTLPAFYIDKTEVTCRAYAEFCRAKGRPVPKGCPESRRNYPVSDITIVEAQEFAGWAGKRLPTAAEWEKAARGADGRLYPWGNQPDSARANIEENRGRPEPAAMPADSFPNGASPCGALNMTGNVAEFVKELITPSPAALDRFAKVLAPPPAADEPWYTIRGGAWSTGLAESVTYEWSSVPARWRAPLAGFRCARDVK